MKKEWKFIAPDGIWKKTYCDLHHTTEVRYYCDFKQKFYCMLCIGDHLGHRDEEVNNLAHTIEDRINSLNERFEDRRAAIGEWLLKHKTNIDKLFEVYYKALDDMKASLLTEENQMITDLEQMDKEFDDLAKTLYAYDLRSLYFARDNLWKFEVDVKNKLDLYNEYMPCWKVINSKDIEKLYEPIKSELKEKFEEYLVNIDSKFS